MPVNKACLASLIISGTVHLLLLAYAQSTNQRVHAPGVRAPQIILRAAIVSAPLSAENKPAPIARPTPEQEAKPEPVVSSPGWRDDSYSTVMRSYYPARVLSQMPQPLTSLTAILAAAGGQSAGEQAIRGQVAIRLWINRSGNLDRLSVISSELPQPQEQAAVDAFSQMRFTPGEIDGLAVMTWVDVVLEYGDLIDPTLRAVQGR